MIDGNNSGQRELNQIVQTACSGSAQTVPEDRLSHLTRDYLEGMTLITPESRYVRWNRLTCQTGLLKVQAMPEREDPPIGTECHLW